MFLWVLEQNLQGRRFYQAIGGLEGDHEDANPPARPGVRKIRCVWSDPASLLPDDKDPRRTASR